MKKILFLLLISVYSYSQTYQNPTYGTVTIKTNVQDNIATKILVQDVSGKINWVNKSIFPLDTNVLHTTGNEIKTGNLYIIGNTAVNISSGVLNIFEVKVTSSDGSASSHGIAIHDGQATRRGINLGVNTTMDYSWIQSAEGFALSGNTLAINPNGGQILINKNTIDGTANVQIKQTSAGPSLLLDNDARPNYIEFSKTGFTDRVSVGALGNMEANLSYNMDYATGVHKYYDSTKNATWLAMHGTAFAMQYAPSGQPLGGDMWTSSGSKYLFSGDNNGRFIINTALGTNTGDAQLVVFRNANKASIAGEVDLVIDGNRINGATAPVYLNRYNTGNVYAVSGGGKLGIGIDPATAVANTFEVKVTTSTGSSGVDGISVNDAAVNKMSLNSGVNTAGAYSWVQSSKGGIGLRPLFLNPNGGGVSIGNTTDLGTGTLNVTGNISTIAATTANHVIIKSQHDLKADLVSPILTGNPTAPTPTAGDNDTTIPTTAFVQNAISTMASGSTYTPTFSSLTNISSPTDGLTSSYTKVGNIVTVMITLSCTVTVANTFSSINVTLPINRANVTGAVQIGSCSIQDTAQTTQGSSGLATSTSVNMVSLSLKPLLSGSARLTAQITYNVLQ